MTDEEAIRLAIDAFIAAYERGDVDALLSLYADDLVKLRFRSLPETKLETAARLREFFAAYSGRLTVRNDEILVAGPVAFTRGTLEIVAARRTAGEDVRIVRRFVELWRKDPGGWRVIRTMDAEP